MSYKMNTKMGKRTKNFSIRFDEEKFEFVKQKLKVGTPQAVVDKLVDRLWLQYHLPEIIADIQYAPPKEVYDAPKADIGNADEPSQFAFVEERRKNMPQHIKDKVKKKFDELDMLHKDDGLEEKKGEPLPILSYQELLRLAPSMDTREKREEFLKEVTRNRKLNANQKEAIHRKLPNLQ